MSPVHLPATPTWLWWQYPWLLLLLLVLPGLWWLWHRPSRRAALRFSDLRPVCAAASSWRHRLRVLLPILRLAGLAALIIAAARPVSPDETSRIFAEGVAIQLVIDTSGSMRDLDLSPPGRTLTRLDVVKDVVRRFVAGDKELGLSGRDNDLIGLIRFARYADAICPLTLDHEHLLDVLTQTRIVRSRSEDGTAIGDGLALAVERLKDLTRSTASGQRLRIVSRVVILLTDGENNFGVIAPRQAGDLAAAFGIKVYTILAGTGQNRGFGLRTPVDDSDLRYIAETTGGQFFHARNSRSLREIYRQIDKLERSRVEERRYLRWGELSRPLVLAAFAALSLQTLLAATLLRKVP